MISNGRNYPERTKSAEQLLEDLKKFRDISVYVDPDKRLKFLKNITPESFFRLTSYINARMRNMDPSKGENLSEKGGSMPGLGAPPPDQKKGSFITGADVIHEYLNCSHDSVEDKLLSAGMAAEALIIWVHPFDDGNGRTSRFVGKFIEDGIDEGADDDDTVEYVESDMSFSEGISQSIKRILVDKDIQRHILNRSLIKKRRSFGTIATKEVA